MNYSINIIANTAARHQWRFSRRLMSSQFPSPKASLPKLELDTDFYLNPANTDIIRQNIAKRLCVGVDIDRILAMNTAAYKADDVSDAVLNELKRVPNMSHPRVIDYAEPKVIHEKKYTPPSFKLRNFEKMAKSLNGARMQNLTHLSGERTYYLTGVLAELEQALINWTVDFITERGFNLISVPDILHPDIIERCGMNVEGERTQVYQLDPEFGKAALSGTAEMAIGGFLMSKTIDELPLRLCAVSRCYRAEASRNQHDKGLYRVHQFNKVEMFVVTSGNLDSSQAALEEVHAIEREMFDQLGIAYRVLDMSPDELGNPAASKYDIEAWMPGPQFWGEISSCSDCTDYQARRLNIRDSNNKFCHTVNGTACAVPRMIITLCEQCQTDNGCLEVPPPLVPYLDNRTILQAKPRKQRPNLVFVSGPNYFDDAKMKSS